MVKPLTAFLEQATRAARECALRSAFDRPHPPRALLPGDDDLAQRWPGGRLLCFAPSDTHPRRTWVSCGLSAPNLRSPDADLTVEERFSGCGIELVLETKGDLPLDASLWAPALLLNVLESTVLARETNILPGDVVGCGPISDNSPLTHLVALQCPLYPSRLLLPAGHVALVHLLGATAAEVDAAQSCPPLALGQALLDAAGQNTDPQRACLAKTSRFEAALARHSKKSSTQSDVAT